MLKVAAWKVGCRLAGRQGEVQEVLLSLQSLAGIQGGAKCLALALRGVL